jgi:hypothetical protein
MTGRPGWADGAEEGDTCGVWWRSMLDLHWGPADAAVASDANTSPLPHGLFLALRYCTSDLRLDQFAQAEAAAAALSEASVDVSAIVDLSAFCDAVELPGSRSGSPGGLLECCPWRRVMATLLSDARLAQVCVHCVRVAALGGMGWRVLLRFPASCASML